ncbi:substrate-binding domain-containing protein [Streptomyces sp. CLV115]|uniref:substrate-binding domain-containing protein n=1 Tax=Streptomyces sp. CLV115 TaxID=3138502 RepID=UPI00313E7BB0
MHLHPRHDRILAELRIHGSLLVTDFAARENISAMTVRRDLTELADRGLLRRVHGGAVTVETDPTGGMVSRPVPRTVADDGRALYTLGLIVPDPGYYYPNIVGGVVERTTALGGRVVLRVSGYDADHERQQIESLIAGGVDGLLVTTTVADAYRTFERLEAAPMPVIAVERAVAEAPVGYTLESVRSDHDAGAATAVRHLAGLGHRRIGVATFDTPTTGQLFSGHRRTVRHLGLADDAPVEIIDAASGIAGQTGAFLDRCRATGTTAVLVHSDHYALDFVATAMDLGVQIPGDLSVVAYDDEVAKLAAVPLTAVAPPKHDVGRFAATACFERISAAGQRPFAQRHITLAPTLTVRDSSAPPR